MRLAILLLCTAAAFAQRVTISLDGTWQIEDSAGPNDTPKQWRHTGPVPGLTNLATPRFENVDEFDSREIINNRIRKGVLPPEALPKTVGIPRQNRTYFWYRKTFTAPAPKQVAILRIGKAQFGAAVWVNGKSAGEHAGCFTAGYFDITPAIRWNAENEVLVRIGAHPAALPPSVPTGTDFEKLKWTPGIYDKVEVFLSNNPVIETIQIAPKVNPPRITVQTVLRNYGKKDQEVELAHTVAEWRGGKQLTHAARSFNVEAGKTATVLDEIQLPNARLWSPEDPFLYVLETTTGGDAVRTRFGVREFRFDTPTRRAWLNGRPYFLRGSNITLHRFFEDPKCGRLPWDETWVRKLLAEIPKKQMHWNAFRFCIGPVPEFWFDIADEAGLLIQNEYFIWTGAESWAGYAARWNEWSEDQLFTEYREFMRDHWNHPSMALWDASNETESKLLAEKIIPEVRKLDLSNRPWENGYNLPSGPDDPVEDHPYLFSRLQYGGKFSMTELETMTGAKSTNSPHPTGHPAFVNEYGWLWLNRDGTPTVLTDKVYEQLLGAGATPEQRFKKNAYLLAGLTEFWRAHRNFAGVLHFVYLMSSYKGVYTSDHFRDVEKLELEPNFAEWVGEAFKPLGVYINFFQEKLKASAQRRYAVMLVNDYGRPLTGKLTLSWVGEGGEEASRAERGFVLSPNGQMTYDMGLATPAKPGRYTLRAVAASGEVTETKPTVCRREVMVE